MNKFIVINTKNIVFLFSKGNIFLDFMSKGEKHTNILL